MQRIGFSDGRRDFVRRKIVAHDEGVFSPIATVLLRHDDLRAVLSERFEVKTDGKIAFRERVVDGADEQIRVVDSIKTGRQIMHAADRKRRRNGSRLARRAVAHFVGCLRDVERVARHDDQPSWHIERVIRD